MDIKKELRRRLLKEDSGKHEYGAVMIQLDVDEDWWKELQGKIDDDDVYTSEGPRGFGREDEVHVTVLYGIHDDVPDEDVESLIDNMIAPEITLKKIGIFDNSDKGFDVVKFDISSTDLTAMNKKFTELPHTTDYPDYEAHATIAYVKGGTGNKYTRTLSKDDEITVKPTQVVYSRANGKETTHDLK